MKNKLCKTPYEFGYKDGYEEGDNFSSGLTWNSPKKNEEYDKGVNAGQAARKGEGENHE
jgi:hypothetical protein